MRKCEFKDCEKQGYRRVFHSGKYLCGEHHRELTKLKFKEEEEKPKRSKTRSFRWW